MISQDLLDVPEIKDAKELTKESSFTKAELEAYDKFWDSMSTERSLIADAEEKGKLQGEIKGKREGKIEGKRETAKNLLSLGVLTIAQIAQVTEVSIKEIEEIRKA